MAALHSALQTLSPTSFSSLPNSPSEIKEYLQNTFTQAQLIIDSVPPPPLPDIAAISRSRSNTSASNVSSTSEMSVSSARSDPIDSSNIPLQKEWGKSIKLAPKDNPLGMAVYKLAGKDGKGAWFARRSVHEGMGFKKWKMGLQREFPESMAVQGAPGEGNIRGIGGERRVERIGVDDVGTVEVYHLSAQFPGPTAPRDFVTLLITSSSALGDFKSTRPSSSMSTDKSRSSRFDLGPRHFMVISKPCVHSDCPPRDGYIRGQYESVEFIREIPPKPKKTSSSTQFINPGRVRTSSSLDRTAQLRSTYENADHGEIGSLGTNGTQIDSHTPRLSVEEPASGGGRRRGRTISFAESRGFSAKGEAVDTCQDDSDDMDETNPVEWIMVTRSDPGGSVPRFLVERGTPSGIVADASKFLEWAIKKELPSTENKSEDIKEGNSPINVRHQDLEAYQTNGHLAGLDEEEDEMKEGSSSIRVKHQDLEAYQTNGHLAGLDGVERKVELLKPESTSVIQEPPAVAESGDLRQSQHGGLLASVANLAFTGIGPYAPQILIDHLPFHQQSSSISVGAPSIAASVTTGSEVPVPNGTSPAKSKEEISSISSASSIVSFASAEDHFEPAFSSHTISSLMNPLDKNGETNVSPHDKELAKLNERKKALGEKLAKTREKEIKDKEELTSKDEERLRKAEEKHAREVQRQEEKYKKEVAKLEARRARDVTKEEERKRKAEDRVERTRLIREKDELRQQLEVVSKERDLLKEQVGALQRENTALVAKMGRSGEGQDLLRDLRAESMEGTRSRSGSLRKLKPPSTAIGAEITAPAGGK